MATLIPCTGTGKDTPGSVITGEQILLPGRPGHNRFCMVIDNVLNSDECKEWIRIADNVGYKEAVVNIGGGREILDQNYRRGERSIIDDQSMSQLVYKRISAYLPTSYAEALQHPVGLNERLRFLKYDMGGFFQPHSDSSYRRPDGSARSRMTLMLYLNHGDKVDFGGGRTLFLSKFDGQMLHAVIPKPGRVLIFDHSIYHEGEEVSSGTKICVRTDVMFGN